MYNSSNRSDFYDSDTPFLDLTELKALMRQQAQHRPLFENVAIIGCGYVGTAVADYWQQQNHFITATTTSPKRVAELQEVAAQLSGQGKSRRVSNQKLKAVGFELIYPQLLI